MKKVRMLLFILGSMALLNSCTVLALGTGAAIGGYTCAKTDVCDRIINRGSSGGGNIEEENVEVEEY